MPRKEKLTHETEKQPFARRLTQIMKETGTTQELLANAIGVRRQTVSLYMTGQSRPDTSILSKIVNYFCSLEIHLTSDWLLGLTKDKSREPSAIDQLGLTSKSIKQLKASKEIPAFKNTVNTLLEDEKIIGLLGNYFWSFTLLELRNSKFKYVPLKNSPLQYTQKIAFALIIEYLPELRSALKEKFLNDLEFIDEFLLSFLEKHADLNECRDICYGEDSGDCCERIYEPEDFSDPSELEVNFVDYEKEIQEEIKNAKDFQEKQFSSITTFLEYIERRNKGKGGK